MSPDHEVAIVGGGPVGLLLGCLLADAGIDVAVFERRRAEAGRSRAIGILPPGRRALEAAGVGAKLARDGLRIERGVAIVRGRTLAVVSLRDAPVLTLEQPQLEALLRARLTALAPTAWSSGIEITQPRNCGDRVRFTVGHAERSARILVAADGVRSAIRGELGIGWLRSPGTASYLMADGEDLGDLGPDARLYCEADGIVESFPLPAGRRRWVARVAPGTPTDPAALATIVRARTGIDGRLGDARASGFVARQHRASALAAGRIVLVGDAAHEVSPIGGQGMNLGWVGAIRLAAAILTGWGTAPDFSDYERAQLASARTAQRRARFNMAMGAPMSGLSRVLREASVRTLGAPMLRGAALRAFTMRGL